MRKTLYTIAAIAIFLISSCGDGTKEGTMSKNDRLTLIQEMEDKAYADMDKFDTTIALGLVKNYDIFCDENPDDEMSPNFLFKAADLCMALNKSQLALEFYNRIIDDYPDYQKVPYCMFLKGFVYEDQLNDFDAAKEAYTEFIEKYPDHDMAEAAKFSIKNLGKSPEELIREFEKKQDTTQVQI